MHAYTNVPVLESINKDYENYANSLGLDKNEIMNEALFNAIEEYKIGEECLKIREEVKAGKMETISFEDVLKDYGMKI